MQPKGGSKLYRLGMWLGRKFIAMALGMVTIILAGIFSPEKLSTISVAIVGLVTAYIGGHAATDVMTRDKTTTAVTKTEVQVTDAKAKPPIPETEEAD